MENALIKLRIAAGALVAASMLTACAAGPASDTGAAPADGATAQDTAAPSLPPTSGVFDYQLGGAYDEVDLGGGPEAIDVVVRDATADPLDGAYSVCYVNGFQTQPGDAETWLERDELLLHDADGELVTDPEWQDEYILDPGTPEQREGILGVLGPIIDGCAGDGFDAVEIDNLDTWTRFGEIDESSAQALAAAYVERAHDAGLAIAQKNAAEVTRIAHDELGFDFAITEECGVWSECGSYTGVYGDHVLQIEYPDALEEEGTTFEDVCGLADRAPLTILRDRDLVAAGRADYVYGAC